MPCPLLDLKKRSAWNKLAKRLAKRQQSEISAENTVKTILEDVRQNGDTAIRAYTAKYDCKNFSGKLKVSAPEIRRAAGSIEASDMEYIRAAAKNIRAFHEAQKTQSWFVAVPGGTLLGQKTDPIGRAGLYVPGGQSGNTPLISSLLMTAIPAQAAGVKSLAVASPPRADGSINPYILAAAHELGISEIYRMGSAWAIAALAYGTKTIAPVDIIAGPGNIWVNTAKRLAQSVVGIDMPAGPSEILILADKSANPAWIAADMLSQAEHDPLSSAICLTDDTALAKKTINELTRQCATLPRAQTAMRALADWSAVAITAGMEDAIELANRIAPEHLEIMTADPWAAIPHIRNAGAIFVGKHSPEALGDYFAGPSHVLPTTGTARFCSALSVETFLKRTSIIAANAAYTQQCIPAVARLARLEGLEAHARSIEIRKQG
jgi:histidinol dehydrogenase